MAIIGISMHILFGTLLENARRCSANVRLLPLLHPVFGSLVLSRALKRYRETSHHVPYTNSFNFPH